MPNNPKDGCNFEISADDLEARLLDADRTRRLVHEMRLCALGKLDLSRGQVGLDQPT